MFVHDPLTSSLYISCSSYPGRYPIHFHMAGDHPNSTVSKNLVRNSNQRCVVIHGTDSILVEENVAYDTVGHCFINENGVEEDIRFIKNLGALTHRQPEERRIGNPLESDHRAYTFWFTNANVRVEGNVAAGAREFISCGHLHCSVFVRFMTNNIISSFTIQTLEDSGTKHSSMLPMDRMQIGR